MGYALRTQRYRYIEWQDWESKQVVARELYDLASDPQETRNIAGIAKHKAAVEEMSQILSV